MPTTTPFSTSRACTRLLKLLLCWPATANMLEQSGFILNSLTSLVGPRCSQREKPIDPSLIKNGSAECDRLCEHSMRSASPDSLEIVAICVT